MSGAHNLATGEIKEGTTGEVYKNDLYQEFSPEHLANEGSLEDLAMDKKEGEM